VSLIPDSPPCTGAVTAAQPTASARPLPIEALLGQAIDNKDLEQCVALLDLGSDTLSASSLQIFLTRAIDGQFDDGAIALLDRGADANASHKFAPPPLYSTANIGNLELCRVLLSRGATVEAAKSTGTTALSAAALQGHAAVCALLLDSGACPNVINNRGGTPLHKAITFNNVEVCKVLVAGGADPAFMPPGAPPDYDTPFEYALKGSNVEVALYLVEQFPKLVHGRTRAGHSMLDIVSDANAPLVRAALTADQVTAAIVDASDTACQPLQSKTFSPL
jgi:ankyrin repeat protein